MTCVSILCESTEKVKKNQCFKQEQNHASGLDYEIFSTYQTIVTKLHFSYKEMRYPRKQFKKHTRQ